MTKHVDNLEDLIKLAQVTVMPWERAEKTYKLLCILLTILLGMCLYYIFTTPTYINLEQPNNQSNNNVAIVE